MTGKALSARSSIMRGSTAAALVTLAGLGFVAALWLGAFAGDFAQNPASHGEAQSRSVEGFYGLTELLALQGVAVRVSRDAQDSKAAQGLLVLTPTVAVAGPALTQLVKGRRALVILPKWFGQPDPLHPGWIARQFATNVGASNVLRILFREGAVVQNSGPSWTTLTWRTGDPDASETPTILRFQTMRSPGLVPVVEDSQHQMVLGRGASSELYVLSDPDLLDNQGLRDVEGARIASEIIKRLAASGPVTFDLSLIRPGVHRNALKLLFTPPFSALSLSLILAACLAGLNAGVRFGAVAPLGRSYDFGKRSLVDSAVSLLELARREPKVAPRYATLIRSRTAQAIGAAWTGSEADLDRELDRLGANQGLSSWTTLVADGRRIDSRAGLVTWAGALYRWSKDMTDGRH